MTIQILTRPTTICNYLVTPLKPIQASSRDYGFDFDEEELARELLAPLPTNFSAQSIPEVTAGEFASRYLWFLS